ncbi:hypothetical protein [Pseudoalteromonas sp. MMG024]|uniref:hypothetical protein n=1 Tax=Pseudoalteromonas sp. MMG024 TaxID=2909980 RepID=UPI001F42F942|nr:hypothetical protein [Pseudoalteromonas sp. MMG024]MCF6455347.1 hypothetical protein [Pseudoalteromonas sp. MMG024]
MSLVSQPATWSHSIAKSKLRVIVFSLLHFALLFLALWLMFDQMSLKQDLKALTFTDLLSSSSLVLFIGGFYPCFYLYAIYRLLETNESDSKL